ncbi:MAG: hypothetical protein K2L07_12070 [Lachnospiraceae bacterium]|nr:hypothetical protein [Lachnospiraceae bacterium]
MRVENTKENGRTEKRAGRRRIGRGLGMIFLCGIFLMLNCVHAQAKNIVSTDHQKYNYKEYVRDLKQLENKYSKHCKVNVIGETADKRNLYEVVLGNPEAEKHLVVIANLHAREYMTTLLCMKQIEYYLQNYNKKIAGKKPAVVFNKVAVHIVPSCNPDGTAISQYGFDAIRNKTLRKKLKKMRGNATTWKANARGVDLNENWGYRFKKSGKAGASGYTGKKAASENETKAIMAMVDGISEQGKIVGVVSYHAMGSVIYGRCSGSATASVKKNTKKMYQTAHKITDYPLYGGGSSACQSREYFLYKKKIPCITLEIGRMVCPVPQSQFKTVWRENKELLLKEAALFY